MINGYEIRENTVTPNSVFLFLLKADEDGRKKIEENLSAFCKLTNLKVKGFDYVFELSGITGDSMLDKFKNQIENLSSSVNNVTQTFGNLGKTETITLSNTSTMPKLEKTNVNKNSAGYTAEDIFSDSANSVKPSMPSLDLGGHKESETLKLSDSGFPISQEKPATELKDLSYNENLSEDEINGVSVEGNSLKIERTIPQLPPDNKISSPAPAVVQESNDKAEERSDIEEENKTIVSFTPEEMKDVSISIERPREKKNIFGGLMNKVKNIFNTKKAPAAAAAPQVEKEIKKEVEREVKKEVKEIEKEIKQEIKEEVKAQIKEENIVPEHPKKKFSLFQTAKDIKNKVENSEVVKEAQEKAKELKEEVKQELQEEKKPEPVKDENPFQDLGSGIIVKKGLFSNDSVDDAIQKEKEDLRTNPITARIQVDDIFAAETVYDLYADNQQQESKNENYGQNHQREEVIVPVKKPEVKTPAPEQKQEPKVTEQKQEAAPQIKKEETPKEEPLKQEIGENKHQTIQPVPVTETIKNIFGTETEETPAKETKNDGEIKQSQPQVQKPVEEEEQPKIAETKIPEPQKVESKLENLRDVFEPEKPKEKHNLDTEVLKSVFKERTKEETMSFFEDKKEGATEVKTETPAPKTEQAPKPAEKKPAVKEEAPANFRMQQIPASKPAEKKETVAEQPKQEIKKEEVKAPAMAQVSPKAEPQKQQPKAEIPAKVVAPSVQNTAEQDLKKESVNMQENKKEEANKPLGENQNEERQNFSSRNETSKHVEKIDHTLHVGTPAKGTKYRNYPIEMPLIPTYTFANMDISPMRFAHAMAMATLENLGTVNNPFLLQGVSGTGKTHFLHAMGYEISKQIPQSKILFTNGVRFSRGIQYSLEKGEKEKLDAFFKGMEVLIIDDVHLTAVNEHNREYISKVLNYFFKHKRQIIFSSKYPPESLKRFEELVNFKFALGTITELKIPGKTHFARLTEKIVSAANLELSELQVQEFFCNRCTSLGDVARDVKRVKVLSRRIESSGINTASSENILQRMTGLNGENEESEIVKKNFEDITALTKNSDDKWGNFGFFFPASQIDKFRWVAFASQEAAKELGIKGGFNYALKSAYSTEHIISAAFKIANICDVKGLKGAVILGPSLSEVKEPIRDNFYDILTHMLEVMMIRCGTINFENIKKPSAYVKMLGDILK